ncbi:hypothetical protein V8C44DRAFT_353325 [Trichoderma aethiopicum]
MAASRGLSRYFGPTCLAVGAASGRWRGSTNPDGSFSGRQSAASKSAGTSLPCLLQGCNQFLRTDMDGSNPMQSDADAALGDAFYNLTCYYRLHTVQEAELELIDWSAGPAQQTGGSTCPSRHLDKLVL